MGNSHNKKRNAGLIYEFLVRHMSYSLANNDVESYQAALKVVEECFTPGSELYREYRLFNALVQTSGLDSTIASTIINEARNAARTHDPSQLKKEKSSLIKKINHTCGKNVYTYHVPEYKRYATIQTLFNEWRSSDPNLGTMAKYEQQLMRWLKEEQSSPNNMLNEEHDRLESSDLVIRMMVERLEKKYGGKLTDEQITILNRYVFMENEDHEVSLKESLQVLRDRVATRIDSSLLNEAKMNELGDIVKANLVTARERISSYVLEAINDEAIARHMKLLELEKELK